MSSSNIFDFQGGAYKVLNFLAFLRLAVLIKMRIMHYIEHGRHDLMLQLFHTSNLDVNAHKLYQIAIAEHITLHCCKLIVPISEVTELPVDYYDSSILPLFFCL